MVVCGQRLLRIQEEVVVCGGDPADMVASGLCGVDHHAVGTHQTIDQRLDGDGAKSGLTVGDDHACLYDVAGNHLGGEPGVDHLDIHIVVGDLAAFVAGVGHLGNDGQRDFGNVQIVDAPIAVTEECPGMAVDGADHALFGLLLEPVVDIVSQKVRFLLKHPVVILTGDVQIGPELLMGSLLHGQRLHLVTSVGIQHTEHRLIAPGLHAQVGGVYQIVRLRLRLTQDLLAHFLNGKTGFHFICSLPSFVYQAT